MELVVCNSLSHDQNNNTIMPVRTVSVLWNWHFSWYLLLLLGASLRRLWPTWKHTSMRPLSAPVFLCDILPAAVCSSSSSSAAAAEAFFSQTVLFCSVVSIHTTGLREFNKIPLRICSYPKFRHKPREIWKQGVVSSVDNRTVSWKKITTNSIELNHSLIPPQNQARVFRKLRPICGREFCHFFTEYLVTWAG